MADLNSDQIRKGWEHLKLLAGRWGETIPDDVNHLLNVAHQPATIKILEVLSTLIKSGSIDNQTAEQAGVELAEAVGLTKMAAYYIGMENGNRLKSSSDGLQLSETVVLKLSYDELSVVESCLEATRQNIIKKTAITGQALSRQETDVAKRIEDVRDVVRNRTIESSQNMPSYKVTTKVDSHLAFTQMLLSVMGSVDDTVMEWFAKKFRK